jgi:hypothetical protein
LTADREQAVLVRQDAQTQELQAKARLQSIEAAARRELNQAETSVMLLRLSTSQSEVPLGLEIAKLEQEARKEIGTTHTPHSDSKLTDLD